MVTHPCSVQTDASISSGGDVAPAITPWVYMNSVKAW